MKITPIASTAPIKNPPQRKAVMIIHHNEHTVVNTETKERFSLEPEEAWNKFNEINGVVV